MFRFVFFGLFVGMMFGIGPSATGMVSALRPIDAITNIVILYEENWSFDGLFGFVPGVDGPGSPGYTSATQVDKFGVAYTSLPQPPAPNGVGKDSRFAGLIPNRPFDIATYVNDSTEVYTSDLVHRFYTQQMQINQGKMDSFVAWTDSGALTMSYEGASSSLSLPLVSLASNFTILTRFFQSAFGGSFLSHQFLIANAAPLWNSTVKSAPTAMISTMNLTAVPKILKDQQLTVDGKYCVNTIYSENGPYPAGTPLASLAPAYTNPTIGDLLNNAGVSWKYYSGGWDNATSGNPGPLFQYHHQPYAYFANYGPGTPGRQNHLVDLTHFIDDVNKGTLPAVSYIKQYGADNEHPGYATPLVGQSAALSYINAVRNSPIWNTTLIIVTYDEFGGRYDHVPPPTIDAFGPGVRIPAVLVSPLVKSGNVDSTFFYTHDSINKFITTRFNLPNLNARVQNATSFEQPFNWNATGYCCSPPLVLRPGAACSSQGVVTASDCITSDASTSTTSAPISASTTSASTTSASTTSPSTTKIPNRATKQAVSGVGAMGLFIAIGIALAYV